MDNGAVDRGRSYLDHAASAPLRPRAREVLIEELSRAGNTSSTHGAGRRARAVLEEAREAIAAAVGARPAEVVFTSGGTEADNLALQGAWRSRPRGRIGARARLIASAVEHPAVLRPLEWLAGEGADTVLLPVDHGGVVAPGALAEHLSAETLLVSVQWVNNELGTVQDVPGMAAAAADHGAWSHSDAVQAIGHLPVDFEAAGLDLMSLSAHKLGGPIGIGVLCVRRDLALRPLLFGGGQERELRPGTPAPALAAAFATAVTEAVDARESEHHRLAALGERLWSVARHIPGVRRHGVPGSPAILNLGFDGCRSDDLLLLLDAAGVDCSAGSACAAGVARPSPVLLALGLDDEAAQSALRFSFGWDTTEADIDRAVAALPQAVDRARAARAWS